MVLPVRTEPACELTLTILALPSGHLSRGLSVFFSSLVALTVTLAKNKVELLTSSNGKKRREALTPYTNPDNLLLGSN